MCVCVCVCVCSQYKYFLFLSLTSPPPRPPLPLPSFLQVLSVLHFLFAFCVALFGMRYLRSTLKGGDPVYVQGGILLAMAAPLAFIAWMIEPTMDVLTYLISIGEPNG